MARMSRMERLDRRGIVAIEVDGILARLTQRQSRDNVRSMHAIDAVALATPLASRMRERVRHEHRSATGALPALRGDRVILSAEYARRAGLDSRWWGSSEAMHSALPNPRGYDVTGGMWGGLQVRGSGRDAAIVDFQGTSIGRGVTKIERNVRGRTVAVVKPAKVRNSQKAGAILKQHAVNLVEPSATEADACATALAGHIGIVVLRGLLGQDGVEIAVEQRGDEPLFKTVRSLLIGKAASLGGNR